MNNLSLVSEIYCITHYKFKNESLLVEVFTPPYLHSKNTTTPFCFERLEFLGDSVLNLVVSIILFELYPMADEGDLTIRKNSLICGRKLTEISQSLNLMRLMCKSPGKMWRRGSDTLEALIGAIFIDGGYDKAKMFIARFWKKHVRQLHIAQMDYKSKLYIWAQRHHIPSPLYKTAAKTQSDTNITVTLQMKKTYGLGIVKVTTEVRKRGELDAAKAMLARIENREKWKTLFRSAGTYINDEDFLTTSEDIKRRLYLWCMGHDISVPRYKTVVEANVDNGTQFTTLVTIDNNRGAYGVSNSAVVAEKKAAFKMLLRMCDEERERKLFGGFVKSCEIDTCLPKNFKSLVDEWLIKNRLGEVQYTVQELLPNRLFNVSLTIPKSDLGTVFSQSYKKRLAEQKAAALMIERILTRQNSSENKTDNLPLKDTSLNYKVELHTWTHTRRIANPDYKVENVTGPNHNLFFTVSVSVVNLNKTVASDYSIRMAQQKAASLMLEQIKSLEKLYEHK